MGVLDSLLANLMSGGNNPFVEQQQNNPLDLLAQITPRQPDPTFINSMLNYGQGVRPTPEDLIGIPAAPPVPDFVGEGKTFLKGLDQDYSSTKLQDLINNMQQRLAAAPQDVSKGQKILTSIGAILSGLGGNQQGAQLQIAQLAQQRRELQGNREQLQGNIDRLLGAQAEVEGQSNERKKLFLQQQFNKSNELVGENYARVQDASTRIYMAKFTDMLDRNRTRQSEDYQTAFQEQSRINSLEAKVTDQAVQLIGMGLEDVEQAYRISRSLYTGVKLQAGDQKTYRATIDADERRRAILAGRIDPNADRAVAPETVKVLQDYEAQGFGGENARLRATIEKNLGAVTTGSKVADELITKAAQELDIDPDELFAMSVQESSGKIFARSGAGAYGALQVIPETFDYVNKKYFAGRLNYKTPADNILAGAMYYKEQKLKFGGDIAKAVAAYHRGPGDVIDDVQKMRRPQDYDKAADTYVADHVGKVIQNYRTIKSYGTGASLDPKIIEKNKQKVADVFLKARDHYFKEMRPKRQLVYKYPDPGDPTKMLGDVDITKPNQIPGSAVVNMDEYGNVYPVTVEVPENERASFANQQAYNAMKMAAASLGVPPASMPDPFASPEGRQQIEQDPQFRELKRMVDSDKEIETGVSLDEKLQEIDDPAVGINELYKPMLREYVRKVWTNKKGNPFGISNVDMF